VVAAAQAGRGGDAPNRAVMSVNGSEVFPDALPSIVNPSSKVLCWVTFVRRIDGSGYISKWLDDPSLVTFKMTRFAGLTS
jgi:hypothetical protein